MPVPNVIHTHLPHDKSFHSFTVTLASAKTILRNEQAAEEEEGYDYYQVPAYGHSGYSTSGTSSYASGYSKRSLDFPSFLNMPVVQKLTESVHRAIEAYSAQN